MTKTIMTTMTTTTNSRQITDYYNLDVGVRPAYTPIQATNYRSPLAKLETALPEREDPYLQIGEVAERTSVTQRTLRFYEEKGLLKPPSRMDGGFRLYSEADVKRVKQIRRLQDLLGVALADIKEMVDAEEMLRELRAQYDPESGVSEKRRQLEKATEVVQAQYAIVQQKMGQMHEMKSQLEERLATFERWSEELERLADTAPVAGG